MAQKFYLMLREKDEGKEIEYFYTDEGEWTDDRGDAAVFTLDEKSSFELSPDRTRTLKMKSAVWKEWTEREETG